MYKTKVQELCQRRSWPLPTYDTTREGPDHDPRFTSTVTVNGASFQTPSPTRNSKSAQNDAAMLAFHHFSPPSSSPSPLPSPPSPSFPEHSLSISALSSFPQPSLCNSSSGAPDPKSVVDDVHLPTNGLLQLKFEEVCQISQISNPLAAVRDTITLEDQKMKDAEHAAAEAALMSLSPGGVEEGHAGLYKNLLQELAQKEGFRLPIYTTNKNGEAHMPIFVSQVEVEGALFTGQKAKSKKQAEMSAAKVAYMALKEHKVKNFSTSSGNTNGYTKVSSTLSNDKSSPSLSGSSKTDSETSDKSSTAVDTTSSCIKKIVVYSRKTNVKIEDGGTMLPVSDDKWVAYSYSH